jgi:hypothetical protein
MKKEEFEYLIESNPEVARIELESQGLKLRVIRIDGQGCMITQDIRKDRINVAVVDGAISEIEGIY